MLGVGYTKKNKGFSACPPGISNPVGKIRLTLKNRTASDTKGLGIKPARLTMAGDQGMLQERTGI